MRRRWQLYRPAAPRRGLRTALLLTAAFVALAFVTRLLCLDQQQSTVFWAANGAMVVALLVLPGRLAALVLALCFAANLVLNLITLYTPYESVMYCVLNVALSLAVAFFTRRHCGATTDLSRPRRLLSFVVIALVAASLEAGAGELLSGGFATSVDVNDCLQWVVCDAFGLLVSTPALMLCFSPTQQLSHGDARPLERWLLLGGAVVLSFVSFSFARSPSFLLVYPLLVSIAFRAGPAWVLVSILLISTIASGMTAHGWGPLAYLAPPHLLLGQGMVQPFVISLFLAAVPANAALGEKGRARLRLLRMKDDIEHAATHDPLTELANRELFRRRLASMLRAGTPFATLFVDLDRFKEVNDTMGHAAGDQLLRIFAARLLEAAGQANTVARLGGDEFALLAPCGGQDTLDDLCARVLNAARTPILLDSGPAHVSASVGVAARREDAETASELMRRADVALYAAKAAGRDNVVVFSEAMDLASRTRSELEAELRAALAGGVELELRFNAKIDASGHHTGAAAVPRWAHPARGVLPAAEIVAIAEEAGLVMALGEWVLRGALDVARAQPWLRVAVPVSTLQLRHANFVAGTLRALEAAGVAGDRLELEITEAALMAEPELVRGKLTTLRRAGVRVALQDFGRGFSSVTRLHGSAVDRVIIDRSFVTGIGVGREATAIIQAIIQLGRGMGLETTADGVETEAQLAFLRSAGVAEFQGALIGAEAADLPRARHAAWAPAAPETAIA